MTNSKSPVSFRINVHDDNTISVETIKGNPFGEAATNPKAFQIDFDKNASKIHMNEKIIRVARTNPCGWVWCGGWYWSCNL